MPEKYDLEERTFQFTKQVIVLVKRLKSNLPNIEYSKQLIRSSGSIGANYIEANEAISKKDFIFRIKICRKEAKESHYWLRLLDYREDQNSEKDKLVTEALELAKIFGSIVYNYQNGKSKAQNPKR